VPHASGKPITFSFTTASAMPATSHITLSYPAGFFAFGVSTPVDITQMMISVTIAYPIGFFVSFPESALMDRPVSIASTSSSSIVLSFPVYLAELPLVDYYHYSITVLGLKLGSARPPGSNLILSTTLDPGLSPCIWTENDWSYAIKSSAPIREAFKVLFPSITLSGNSFDFVAGRSIDLTVSFTLVNPIHGGNIFFQLPSNLILKLVSSPWLCEGSICFKSLNVTRYHSSNILKLTIGPEYKIISAKARIDIKFFAVVFESPFNFGGFQGITITTDSHSSPAVAFGNQVVVPNCVFPVRLRIPSQYRQSGRRNVPITLSFTPQSILPSGSTITVNFPPYLFTDGPQSLAASSIFSSKSSIANLSATTVLSAADSPLFSSFIIAISGPPVPYLSPFSIILDGMTIGNPTENIPNSIRVTTSADTMSCIGTDTGVILEQPLEMPSSSLGSNPCACKTKNSTVSLVSLLFNGRITTRSSDWQILNATQVDTCDFSVGNVAAVTYIFEFQATGYYSLSAFLSNISLTSISSSWSFMARSVDSTKGGGCCGNTAFCGTLSSKSPTWMHPKLFIRAGDTMSIVLTTPVSSTLAPSATVSFSIFPIRDPVVYVDSVLGKAGNSGSFDEPVASFQEGLNVLGALVTSSYLSNITATMIVRPTIYGQSKPHMPQATNGFIIPDELKNVALVISSLVSQKATSVYSAYQEQVYCNYNINNCTSQSRFFEASFGTAMDTEISANVSIFGRAFTLKDMFSLTLQGFTIQNFANPGNGGAFSIQNSTLVLKNCVMKGNLANAYGNGGAIFATRFSTVIIQDSIFLGHRARGSGGIVYASLGSVLVIDRSVLQGTHKRNCRRT
jgi:hypothetical protein